MMKGYINNYILLLALAVFIGVIFWSPIPESWPLFGGANDSWLNLSANTVTKPLVEADLPIRTKKIKPKQVPILMYHYIRDSNSLPAEDTVGKNLSVSAKTLAKHLGIIQAHNLKFSTLKKLAFGQIAEPSVILTFDDGYKDFYSKAWPVLDRAEAVATVFVISERVNQFGYLSAENLQTLAAAKIEIGSHSISHPNLTNASENNLFLQLDQSKTDLESIIGQPIYSFSYPSGQYNEQVVEATKLAGYRTAVTTDYNLASTVKSYDSYYRLPRLRIKENTDLNKLLTDYGF